MIIVILHFSISPSPNFEYMTSRLPCTILICEHKVRKCIHWHTSMINKLPRAFKKVFICMGQWLRLEYVWAAKWVVEDRNLRRRFCNTFYTWMHLKKVKQGKRIHISKGPICFDKSLKVQTFSVFSLNSRLTIKHHGLKAVKHGVKTPYANKAINKVN